jgi:hypothetical protein
LRTHIYGSQVICFCRLCFIFGTRSLSGAWGDGESREACARDAGQTRSNAVTLTAHRAPGRGGRARVAVGLGSQVVSVDVEPGCGGRNTPDTPRGCGGERTHAARARSRFTSKVILLRFTYQLSHSLRVSTSTTMLMLCTCKVACTLSERLLPKFERIEARAASSPADEVRPMPRAAWGLPLGSIGDISAGQFQTMLREPLSDHRAWHARRQPQPRLWLQPHQH